MLVTHLLQLG